MNRTYVTPEQAIDLFEIGVTVHWSATDMTLTGLMDMDIVGAIRADKEDWRLRTRYYIITADDDNDEEED